MSDFDRLLARLRASRERAISHLKAIDRAIANLEAAKEALPEEMLEDAIKSSSDDAEPMGEPTLFRSKAAPQRERGILSPLKIATAAREAILAAGRPLKRGQLVRELERREIPLAGKDKSKNLGTILWRHESMFVSIPKLGYWPKDVPLEGLYDPNMDA